MELGNIFIAWLKSTEASETPQGQTLVVDNVSIIPESDKFVVLAGKGVEVGYFDNGPDRVVVIGIALKYPDGKAKLATFQEELPVVLELKK